MMGSRYQGFLDPVRHRTVAGWVWDPAEPERRVLAGVEINGQHAGFTLANRFRADLVEHGIGDGRHGFQFAIADSADEVRSVEVYAVSRDHPLSPADRAGFLSQESNRPLPPAWQKRNRRYPLPSFFILGAAKSGTTSLHFHLNQIPEICMSNPKEPFFFEAEYDRGATFYFNRYFADWDGEPVVGEARHRNLYLPWVAGRIQAYNPDARLIAILRNPIERAISHWWHWYSRGMEPLPLKEALRADLARIEGGARGTEQDAESYPEICPEIYKEGLDAHGKAADRTYLDSGYYREQIDRYLAKFDVSQLKIVLFEDLAADPQGTTAGVLDFLGLDPGCAETLAYETHNRSPAGMLEQVDDEVVAWLREHYAAHNQRLVELVGRPLDGWEDAFSRAQNGPKRR